jgi:hypothetical protein
MPRGPVEASTSHPLSSSRAASKSKTLISSWDLHDDDVLQQASKWASALKKNFGGGFTKDKVARILADSEVGTSRDLPPHIRNLFLER